MRVAIIGRSELMYDTALLIAKLGYTIPLVITSKESPEYKITSKDFEKFALTHNAVFINTAKINSPQVIEALNDLENIDIAVSINYSGVISQNIINKFRLGILNAHGGDLPRYRGNACQAWAIINGESKIGLCIHKMVGGELDSGDIVNRDYYSVCEKTKIRQVYDWMNYRIPELVIESLSKLEIDYNYILEKQSKNPKLALRCYPRTPDDGKIDWHKNNIDIIRLINASGEPFSGAFSSYNGKKIIIWDAEIYEDEEIYLATPGQISNISIEGFIIVITGKGKIKINEIELDGIRTTNVNEMIKSIRIKLI